MTANLTLKFPGYRVEAQLGQSRNFSVYRARPEDGQGTVIIKVIRVANPTAEQVARFRYEFELVRNLEMDGIVRPIELINHDGMPALVMEDFGGISLKQIIAGGLPLERFLKLAIRLADILSALHRSNVSHRDIKPSNILYNPETDVLKITDFGISEIIPVAGELANYNLMEGSLPYISPEQTGRMNCGMDYRTDLYSLGVTFYEMLTGTVPFTAEDPLRMIHAHIAKVPPYLREINPEIPEPVADIVMKLMSKPAADRYQNGLGLSADLQQCLRQLQMTGRIELFKLGTKDVSLRFSIPRLLVGRQEPFDALFSAFERVSCGTAEVVLVEGEPGIGKSALVHEIQKPIVAKGGYFLSGKFDQLLRSVPYSAIIQAFQSLIRQLLSESDEQLRQRKERLSSILYPNGKVIADVIPDIKLIIGSQPDVPELDPEETQNRFNMVFKSFVQVFINEHHPLVLFLDDLQWADTASLKLLRTILNSGDLRHILLIGAYRDTEVAAHHPLMRAREELEAMGVPIVRIHLGPLEPEAVSDLLVSMAGCTPDAALPMAKLVHDKTKGSPFFIHHFLKTLYDKGLIHLDDRHGWGWELEKIQALTATDNVVDYMSQRLHELSATGLELIQLCACFGNRFDVEILVALTQRSRDEVYAVIDAFAQDELIVRNSEGYRFYHNRIQEAAYALLSPTEKQRWHYRIGTLLIEQTPDEHLSNQVFIICDHLNLAAPLIDTSEEKIRLARLNLTAGIKAKESTAYAAAVDYLTTGCSLLPEGSWDRDYDLTFQLFAEQMQCQYLIRDFEEAARLYSIIVAKARKKEDLAKAHAEMILLYTNTQPAPDAVRMGLKALEKVFGIRCEKNIGKWPVFLQLIKARRLLKKIGIDNILDLPLVNDKILTAKTELILTICTAAFYVNPNLFAWLILKGFNDSLKHGVTRHSSHFLVSLANIIQTVTGDYDQSFRLGEIALKLDQRFNNLKSAGAVYNLFGFFIFHWRKPVKQSLDIYEKALELSMNSGDFITAGHAVMNHANIRLVLGNRLDDVQDELDKNEKFMSLLKDPVISAEYRIARKTIQALKGETPLPYDISDEGFDGDSIIDRVKVDGNLFGLIIFLFFKLYLLVLYRQWEAALPVISQMDKLIKIPMGTIIVPYYYFCSSLVLLGLIKAGKPPAKSKSLIRRNQRKTRKYAALCPENYKCFHDLIAAELAGLKGHSLQAAKLFNTVIADARKMEYTAFEAFACEFLADFYLDRDFKEEAGIFMRRAHELLSAMGYTVKADTIKSLHPVLFPAVLPTPAADTSSGATSTETTSMQLDFSTVMKVSHVISSEIMLERLLAQIMQISIASAGAQRGYLILEADGQLKVQASQAVDTGEEEVLQDVPIESCPGLSPAIVNYVYHSAEPMILGNAMVDGPFVNDPHVSANQCKSVLCVPILNKGELKGILYMENNLAADVFTSDRIEILGVISAQAAISLQNARLFSEVISQMAIRKQAEEALSSSEKQYRLLVENASDGIYITQDGRIKYHNPKTCEITGYDSASLAQMAFMDLVHPQDKERVLAVRNEEGKGPEVFGFRILNRQKEVIWVELNAVAIIWEGRPAILNFLRDVTRLKKTENRLQQAQKMETIGTLAGGIAHDFNNILSAIVGYTELSLGQADTGSLLQSHLTKVMTACRRAGDLVRQILAFARQSDEKLDAIAVSIIAKEVLKLIRSSIPATIEIRPDIRSNAHILGNPTQVHQIIMNLCTNAAHAMEKGGGVLTLRLVQTQVDDDAHDLNLVKGDYLQLSVTDTGCGIPPEIINSVFEPYFTTKALGEGTGMGLSVVQGIVEKYGGKITVQSRVDEGTTFTVYLPLVEKKAEVYEEKCEPMPFGHERILFVDDEPDIADMSTHMLKELGYEVTALTASLDALRLFHANPDQFDLVITDMTMPKMTGDLLAQEIMRIRPDIPVVLCTGYSLQINEESALAMGIKAFVTKPINKDDLAATVRKALDQ